MSMPLTASEADFSDAVISLARLRGWRVVHFRPAQNRRGQWGTPLQGHPGFPDLVVARDGVVLLRELKTQHGLLRPAQKDWLAHLGALGGVWRPADLPVITGALR